MKLDWEEDTKDLARGLMQACALVVACLLALGVVVVAAYSYVLTR